MACKKEVECESGEDDEVGRVEGEGVRDMKVEVGGVRRQVRCKFETMFVCLPDMPSSDLSSITSQPAASSLGKAVDQKGTVLVHW